MDRHHLIDLPVEQNRRLAHYADLIRRRTTLRSRLNSSKEERADVEERARVLLAEIDTAQKLLNERFEVTFAEVAELTNDEIREVRLAYSSIRSDMPRVGWLERDFILRKFDRPFEELKLYIERAIRVLPHLTTDWQVRVKPESLSPAEEHAKRVASQVQSYLETIRLLEERCEEDVRNHPDQGPEIRRRYRQSIDAIKDKP